VKLFSGSLCLAKVDTESSSLGKYLTKLDVEGRTSFTFSGGDCSVSMSKVKPSRLLSSMRESWSPRSSSMIVPVLASNLYPWHRSMAVVEK
jgi:hypothetical protein